MQDKFIGEGGSQKTADIYYTKHLKDMTVWTRSYGGPVCRRQVFTHHVQDPGC